MIDVAQQTRVYIAREPVDFRKQIDGLSLHVQEVLALDPFAPQLFVFRNRGGDKLKVFAIRDQSAGHSEGLQKHRMTR